MSVNAATRKAYSEVDEFIELLDDYEKYLVPEKLREFFKKEKDPKYYKGINPNLPIKNQGLMEETLAIIALLNLQYWCDDEEEKERLKQIYAENEEKYFKDMREKYNPDNIFEKFEQNETLDFEDSIKEINENLPDVAEYKHSVLHKIWRKIRRIFSRKKEKQDE